MSHLSNFVKLYDTVTITPASVDSFMKTSFKDNFYMPSDKVLCVDIVATHAGRLTRNHGFYLPQKMKDGTSTLLENYGKPMLVHHNSHDDPVGRVIAAKYVDTSMAFARDSALDPVIKDLCNPKLPFLQSLSLVDKLSQSELLRDPAYPGLGHIVITAEINHPDAIEKVLDKRYLTVSIGASTDKAVCSICKQDWIEEGPCEHRPGKMYDELFAYIIAGKLIYDEVSFVNVPADTLARVVRIHNGAVQDSIVVEESQQICNVNASFYFTDSSIGGTSMNKVQKAWSQVSDVLALEDSKEKDKLKALKDFLSTFENAKDACVQEAKDKLAELEPAKPPVQSGQPEDKTDNNDTQVQDDAGDGQSQDDLDLDESDKHYEDMVEFALNLGLLEDEFFNPVKDQVADKKLSPAERKRMPKTTFCKPSERKYPVNDCNHAKVAMAYAKKNNEATSVIACIRRKAKALGCPFNGKKDNFDEFETELDAILADLAERERQQEVQDDNAEEDNTQDTQDDNHTEPCELCQTQEDKVTALRQELKDIYAEFDALQKDHIQELQDAKLQLAKLSVVLDQLNGKAVDDIDKTALDLAAWSFEDLLKKAGEVQDSLDMQTVLDKVNDGMSNVPDTQVEDPTLSDESQEDPTQDDEDPFSVYRDKYKKILFKDGLKAAGDYRMKLIRGGLVPNDFNPEE